MKHIPNIISAISFCIFVFVVLSMYFKGGCYSNAFHSNASATIASISAISCAAIILGLKLLGTHLIKIGGGNSGYVSYTSIGNQIVSNDAPNSLTAGVGYILSGVSFLPIAVFLLFFGLSVFASSATNSPNPLFGNDYFFGGCRGEPHIVGVFRHGKLEYINP